MFRKPQCTAIWCHRAASALRLRNASSQTPSLPPLLPERRPLIPRGAFPTGSRLISSRASTGAPSFLPRLRNTATSFSSSSDDVFPYFLLIGASVGLGFLLGGLSLSNPTLRISQPKYLIYSKTFERIQYDAEVIQRIGSPITGNGQESENAPVSENIPYRIWSNEDGVEHAEVNFYIRGPHGQGKVLSKMFKGPVDTEWKFQYLIVEIRAPSPAHFILESHVPAYSQA